MEALKIKSKVRNSNKVRLIFNYLIKKLILPKTVFNNCFLKKEIQKTLR
jgi:hypothetical protein